MSKPKIYGLIVLVILTFVSVITWSWTRTTYHCAGWVQITDVEDIGDKNFKATYADGSYKYFDDFYMVELNQLKCTGEEVAPPKGTQS